MAEKVYLDVNGEVEWIEISAAFKEEAVNLAMSEGLTMQEGLSAALGCEIVSVGAPPAED